MATTRNLLLRIPVRLLSAMPALFGVLALTFILMRVLPADPAGLMASPSATEAELEIIRSRLGLDRTIAEQFGIYLGQLAIGDFGMSTTSGQPVLTDLAERLPASLELVTLSFLLATVTSLALGIAAALKPNSLLDHFARLVCTVGVSIPTFVSGLLLVYVFYYQLGWAPDPTGRIDIFAIQPPQVTGFLLVDSLLAGEMEAFRSALAQLILPATTLALFILAPVTRITRASMLSVLQSDYVRTAESLGLSRFKVIVVYALTNALLPLLTISGTVISSMLGASVLVEKVFAWPGVASYAVDAIMASDFAPVQGFVLLMATLYVVVNLTIDLLYGLIDPRMSLS